MFVGVIVRSVACDCEVFVLCMWRNLCARFESTFPAWFREIFAACMALEFCACLAVYREFLHWVRVFCVGLFCFGASSSELAQLDLFVSVV